MIKELSIWNKIKYLNLNIFRTRCCKPLIFQTQIIWSNTIHSLKYLRSATFGSKDIVIRKSEFVAKTQLLCHKLFFRLCLYHRDVSSTHFVADSILQVIYQSFAKPLYTVHCSTLHTWLYTVNYTLNIKKQDYDIRKVISEVYVSFVLQCTVSGC